MVALLDKEPLTPADDDRRRALFDAYDAQHTVKLTNDIAREWVKHNTIINSRVDVDELEEDAQAVIRERKKKSAEDVLPSLQHNN